MTDHQADTATNVGPITDPESLRDRVPVHEDTDVVPAETIGPMDLTDVEGVWQLDVRAEDGSDTASRAFVVFSGDLADDALQPPADGVEEAGWFDELPENGSELPGMELFL